MRDHRVRSQDASKLSRHLVRRAENVAVFPLGSLEAVSEIRRYLAQIEREAVQRARDMGATWEDIAHALGVSRQAVFHRFAKPEERQRRPDG